MLNIDYHNKIIPEHKYEIDSVKLKIWIGSSITNTKKINLYYFPQNIQYTINLHKHPYKDTFHFEIKNNYLIIKRLDLNEGWGHNHSMDICIQSKTSFLFFKEECGPNYDWTTSYVTHNNNKILDSRDMEYFNNQGW
jgi:hypothetical protein